ncbi:hypothetical protein IAT38_005956 [Cryptococcus sp. DSM 104549]
MSAATITTSTSATTGHTHDRPCPSPTELADPFSSMFDSLLGKGTIRLLGSEFDNPHFQPEWQEYPDEDDSCLTSCAPTQTAIPPTAPAEPEERASNATEGRGSVTVYATTVVTSGANMQGIDRGPRPISITGEAFRSSYVTPKGKHHVLWKSDNPSVPASDATLASARELVSRLESRYAECSSVDGIHQGEKNPLPDQAKSISLPPGELGHMMRGLTASFGKTLAAHGSEVSRDVYDEFEGRDDVKFEYLSANAFRAVNPTVRLGGLTRRYFREIESGDGVLGS